MALVCDVESEPAVTADEINNTKSDVVVGDTVPAATNDDLEDGEIEDDGEDDVPPPQPAATVQAVAPAAATASSLPPPSESKRESRDRRRHSDGESKKKHMTEAEKSILHLRKRERMQREKWEKHRKEQCLIDSPDDFAGNIEKAIAQVLKKDPNRQLSGDEDKSSRKRKARERTPKGGKQSKRDDDDEEMGSDERTPSNRSAGEDSYDSDVSSDRSRGDERRKRGRKRGRSRGKESGSSRKQQREKSRERRVEQQAAKDAQGVCVFFLQGKCAKNDCPYSHEAVPPMKLELCKFYLMDCCAKGEKCSYMHSEFPCKFYHTGLQCQQSDDCKFAHGKPLSEGLKQILFKHIETAPREILGGFPRMSREEALTMINNTQQNLMAKYGMQSQTQDGATSGDFAKLVLGQPVFEQNVPLPSELTSRHEDKPKTRSRPSRWQDPEPDQFKPFLFGRDQDMRLTNPVANGDIDMRTLPPPPQAATSTPAALQLHVPPPALLATIPPPNLIATMAVTAPPPQFLPPTDITNTIADVDIRQDPRVLAAKDVDIRQIPGIYDEGLVDSTPKTFTDLPKTQRDLFLRIQSQQKEQNIDENNDKNDDKANNDINNFEANIANIDWYSDDDDDDDNRLTIRVDNEENLKEDDEDKDKKSDDKDAVNTQTNEDNSQNNTEDGTTATSCEVKPSDVVEKLGDLSKIDISAEVTKLLTSISQNALNRDENNAAVGNTANRDPRQRDDPRLDPRRAPRATDASSDVPAEKISIYEQGSIGGADSVEDSDFRATRPDVDLRNLQLPFKGMMNYTPAKEIDASLNSHSPIPWRVHIVDIPRPDYTGLKLSIDDAEKTGDPRLRKIFRLSIDDKDSPASPKESARGSTPRVDPRLRKNIDDKSMLGGATCDTMSYTQQLTLLQSSAFFQSLTSNQKVLLTQELASRNSQDGGNDPVLGSLLTNLNLVPPPTSTAPPPQVQTNTAALSILANVNKLNPMLVNGPTAAAAAVAALLNPMNPAMPPPTLQQGLLGAAPGIPNMQPEFPMGFDPRNGGLLGPGPPPPPFTNFPVPPPTNPNFGGGNQPTPNFVNQDDFYQPPPQQNSGGGGGGGNNDDFGGNSRGDRGFNRDRRNRGRNTFNRNSNQNRNFRNNRNSNRTNRGHTPP